MPFRVRHLLVPTLAAGLAAALSSCSGCGGTPTEEPFIPPDGSIGTPGTPPVIAGCNIFPADNPWNLDVSEAPLHPRHAQILAHMSPATALHPDWGNWSTDHYGIPWESGSGAPPAPLTWTTTWGTDESDPLGCTIGTTDYPFCYPIPLTVRIEGGPSAAMRADRHVLYLDTAGAPDDCTLYELYNTQNQSGDGFTAANGAIFHLGSNALRPDGWTSADAAGLPILPGLVRYDEIEAGEIRHAIRLTVETTAEGYIHPATHQSGTAGTDLPPMGLRLRLRASYPETGLTATGLVLVRALKKYGVIVADNGSNWYLTGDSDDRWDAVIGDALDDLGAMHGSDFEVLWSGPTLP